MDIVSFGEDGDGFLRCADILDGLVGELPGQVHLSAELDLEGGEDFGDEKEVVRDEPSNDGDEVVAVGLGAVAGYPLGELAAVDAEFIGDRGGGDLALAGDDDAADALHDLGGDRVPRLGMGSARRSGELRIRW